jgi:hypothetical protein
VTIGGVFGLLSPLGPIPLAVGVSLLALGTVVSAPDAGRPGAIIGAWWTVLALASLVALIGGGLEIVSPGIGRLLVVPASLVAVVTAGLTMPATFQHRFSGED